MVLAAELFSTHGGNRSCAGQRCCSHRRPSTSPDKPDCLPADREDYSTAVVEGSHRCCCCGKPATRTSALLTNCSAAACSFSLCPLQALRADACRARPKEKVRTQGVARGQLLMAFRWTEASSSLWPPERNTIPAWGGFALSLKS